MYLLLLIPGIITLYCDFSTPDFPVTVLHHNLDTLMPVTGYEEKGSGSVFIYYRGVPNVQIAALKVIFLKYFNIIIKIIIIDSTYIS